MPVSPVRLAAWMIIAALPLNLLPQLPAERFDPALMLCALFLLKINRRWAGDLAVVMLLFLWSVSAARGTVQQINALSAKPVEARVQIGQINPVTEKVKVRILSADNIRFFPPVYALLNRPETAGEICTGQRWQMRLKLRPVHAHLNEGGFDAQRFAIANGMPLSGRVLSATPEDSQCGWRDRIISSSHNNYQMLPWHAFISALAFGERGEVSREMNQLLRETGTAHLMAISGMHISLAAGVGWLLGRLLQSVMTARRIGYRFPLALSLIVALIYTWLSGGNPPSVRAMLALSVWSALRLSGKSCNGWQVWLLCIGLILFFDPLSILSDSLWLSAVAVAGLLFWFHWFPLPGRFMKKKRWLLLRLLHLQLGMFLLLMPIQVLTFHGISFSALLANVWAVPIISLLTVPLILCALLFHAVTPLSQLLWWGADRTLALVFIPLSALPAGWINVEEATLPLSMLAWVLVIAWRLSGWRSSPVTLFAFGLAALCWRVQPDRANWRVDMLDVGHGLAVVISRNGEATLYDTGNRWASGDAARSYILPWLNWKGLTVRHVILSHGHQDHIGGLNTIQTAFPLARLHSNMVDSTHFSCHRGVVWRWQSLEFRVVWPEAGERQTGNNQSCVVMISDGQRRVLLTGDIESSAERMMIKKYRQELAADVIQVPHHGSGTSSVAPLLRTVAGRVAIASAARYSAWRLPAERIIKRYKENHYLWHDTALEGQISITFFTNNWQVKGLRDQIMPRWYHQWFGVTRDSR
ncbi:ComEC family protein [Erwinia oleae]|uniref:ComEC family protein n=1 Tax=Erwinia oleae TaxID=796334 RepID=UPI0005532FAA|nr:ComEC family protein [Erwinia oleae]